MLQSGAQPNDLQASFKQQHVPQNVFSKFMYNSKPEKKQHAVKGTRCCTFPADCEKDAGSAHCVNKSHTLMKKNFNLQKSLTGKQ